ncbi:MAG: hypothetical protein GM48_0150 [actinobacterium acIB-AMD-7]|nr:MAG: hypothetical protein GM48_0150 [actinobacterium acIB-AMD-7]
MIKFFLNSRLERTLLRCISIQILIWIIFYPGLYSKDSFEILNSVRNGLISNTHTVQWALFVRYVSLDGAYPQFVTLISSIILVYAVIIFTYSFFEDNLAAKVSTLVCLSPLVWGMGLTLWHDIPSTSGFLLIASLFNKRVHENNFLKAATKYNLVLGSILITFRPNGLPTILLAFVFFQIFYRSRKYLKILAFSLGFSLLTVLFTALIFDSIPPINKVKSQEWMVNDISCYLSKHDDKFFVEKNLDNIGTIERWASIHACDFLNSAGITKTKTFERFEFIPSAWFSLLKNEPIFILKTHLYRNSYLLPIPIDGLPNPPFIHSNIEPNNIGITHKFALVSDFARNLIRAYNYFNEILAWVGLWILIIAYVLILQANSKSFTLFLSLSLSFILLIFAPIPDARYALFTLIAGQILLLGFLLNRPKSRISIQT